MSQPPSEIDLEIDVQSVKTMLESNEDFLFLDCREQNEFEFASVDGATLIPMSEITNRLTELNGFENKRIVVMCHLGGRSLRVTQWLRNNGFALTQNMTGGIDAWSVEIDGSIPRY